MPASPVTPVQATHPAAPAVVPLPHAPTRPVSDLPRQLLSILLIALMIGGSLWVLRPFLPALIWATTVVVATWPLMLGLQKRLWHKRTLAAVAMIVAILLIIVVPLVAAVITLVDHSDQIVALVKAIPQYIFSPPPAWVHNIPLVGDRVAVEWQKLADGGSSAAAARIQPYMAAIAQRAFATAGTAGMLAVHLLLTLVICLVLYVRGEVALAAVLRFAHRMAGERGENVVHLGGQAIRAVALGIVVTALTQSILGGIGLAIVGIPLAGLLTAAMLMLCIAQIGPLPVLICSVGWLYYEQETTKAIILLVISGVVGMLDNFLRPMLIKRGANLPLLLILVGVLGGMFAFGIVGLFVGPVVLAVTYTLTNAWIAEGIQTDITPAQPVPVVPPQEQSLAEQAAARSNPPVV